MCISSIHLIKKLKFYSFDVSGGGTMGEWSNYVQYATAKTQHLDEFESGYINQIQPVRVQNKNCVFGAKLL